MLKSSRRYVYLWLGWFFVVLGAIGVALPLIPTTPYLLLACWFFSKSSPRFKVWLLNHRVFGKYLTYYYTDTKMPLKAKVWTIVFMWTGMGISMYFAYPNKYVIALLIVIGIGVSLHVSTIERLHKKKKHNSDLSP